MSDHISPTISDNNLVALTDAVVIEYPDGLSQRYDRGIYSFSSYKVARKFTTACNAAIEGETVAFRFKRQTNEKDETDD